MANIFQGTPPIWILDTPSTTPVSTDLLRIYRIEWVAGPASTGGEECTLSDSHGNIIFDEYSTGAEFETIARAFDTNKGKSVRGLVLNRIGAGAVWIYLA